MERKNDFSQLAASLQRFSVPVTIFHGEEKPLIRKDNYGEYVRHEDLREALDTAYRMGYDDGKGAP